VKGLSPALLAGESPSGFFQVAGAWTPLFAPKFGVVMRVRNSTAPALNARTFIVELGALFTRNNAPKFGVIIRVRSSTAPALNHPTTPRGGRCVGWWVRERSIQENERVSGMVGWMDGGWVGGRV
jgi:hypothetical protein